jgi:hypothetical protein
MISEGIAKKGLLLQDYCLLHIINVKKFHSVNRLSVNWSPSQTAYENNCIQSPVITRREEGDSSRSSRR